MPTIPPLLVLVLVLPPLLLASLSFLLFPLSLEALEEAAQRRNEEEVEAVSVAIFGGVARSELWLLAMHHAQKCGQTVAARVTICIAIGACEASIRICTCRIFANIHLEVVCSAVQLRGG